MRTVWMLSVVNLGFQNLLISIFDWDFINLIGSSFMNFSYTFSTKFSKIAMRSSMFVKISHENHKIAIAYRKPLCKSKRTFSSIRFLNFQIDSKYRHIQSVVKKKIVHNCLIAHSNVEFISVTVLIIKKNVFIHKCLKRKQHWHIVYF